MLSTTTIEQLQVDRHDVFAFRIHGEIHAEDMTAMAAVMNEAFDENASVSMLLIFDDYEGVEAGAGLDMESLKSQFRSLSKVEKYAVVGAPGLAEAMINIMDKLSPVDARTFDRADEAAAWIFVDAKPICAGSV